MRVFRKRRKFGNFHGKPEDAEPLPDIVYQMGAESAARFVAQNPLPPNHYGRINSSGYEGAYGFSPVYSHMPGPQEELSAVENRSSSPFNFIRSALGIGRSRIDEQYVNRQYDPYIRSGSPQHFGHHPMGTPVTFPRRSSSPEFLQARASSPYHFVQPKRVSSPIHYAQYQRASSPVYFGQQSRSASPSAARRLQRAQLSQELQNLERQQRQQQEMMMGYQVQFIPQYQQAQQPFYSMMNPNGNMQAWHLMQQQQMYPFY